MAALTDVCGAKTINELFLILNNSLIHTQCYKNLSEPHTLSPSEAIDIPSTDTSSDIPLRSISISKSSGSINDALDADPESCLEVELGEVGRNWI